MLKATTTHFRQRSVVPSRKEIHWSQLKVGALVLVAMAVLIGLIFLMSGSTGGFFAKKIELICYFQNASGLKQGAPVTLEGVTIGNVAHVGVVAGHNPNPVKVVMRVGTQYLDGLHTDSLATITQAGVLGDSYVDIDSTHATGPQPTSGTVLKASGSPTLQDLIGSSNAGISQIRQLTQKVSVLIGTLNSNRGLIGRLINDKQMANKFVTMTNNLEAVSAELRSPNGTLGKLLTDDTLYNRANTAINNIDTLTASLNSGKGTAGKLLKDPELYNNLNKTVTNANELITQINSGKGTLGKLAKDPKMAKKLDDTITQLDTLLAGINQGKGTMGQLFKNRSLYDNLDQTSDQASKLIKGIRENPRKYLVIRLKLF